MKPTYNADEIKDFCLTFQLDSFTFQIIVDLVEEELHLYNEDELITLMDASMIFFTRSMLKLSLKNIK